MGKQHWMYGNQNSDDGLAVAEMKSGLLLSAYGLGTRTNDLDEVSIPNLTYPDVVDIALRLLKLGTRGMPPADAGRYLREEATRLDETEPGDRSFVEYLEQLTPALRGEA